MVLNDELISEERILEILIPLNNNCRNLHINPLIHQTHFFILLKQYQKGYYCAFTVHSLCIHCAFAVHK